MALSNWDTIAFDDVGPCGGEFHSSRDTRVWAEIYKNWLYLHAPYTIQDHCYIEDTIGQIWEGNLKFSFLEVKAQRGPQDAIFVLVSEFCYFREESGKPAKPSYYRHFAGVGCYAFEGDECVGVLPSTVDDFFKWLRVQDGSSEENVRERMLQFEAQGLPLTLERARKYCESESFQAWVRKCQSSRQ